MKDSKKLHLFHLSGTYAWKSSHSLLCGGVVCVSKWPIELWVQVEPLLLKRLKSRDQTKCGHLFLQVGGFAESW